MLGQVLDYIHNYFVRNVIYGTFEVVDGAMSVDGLLDGQYYIVKGSIFNDGLHRYPSTDLVDEVFNGEISAMAVPPDLLALVQEIQAWADKYGDVMSSPYSSESFGGYSYSKRSGSSPNSQEGVFGWQDVFRSRLNKWRKII